MYDRSPLGMIFGIMILLIIVFGIGMVAMNAKNIHIELQPADVVVSSDGLKECQASLLAYKDVGTSTCECNYPNPYIGITVMFCMALLIGFGGGLWGREIAQFIKDKIRKKKS